MFTAKSAGTALLLLLPLVAGKPPKEPFPTITMIELSDCLELECTGPHGITVLTGVLNDVMDLLYSVPSEYTAGKRILPTEVTIEDVKEALKEQKGPEKFKKIFRKMQEKYESGDFTPEPEKSNIPVLQFVDLKG